MNSPGAQSVHPVHGLLALAMEHSESLCIKCGFCLPFCPTYRETGSEAASPRGRLDLMYRAAKGEMSLEEISVPVWQCVGCLACETACPSGIRYRDMLEATRAAEHDRGQPGAPGLFGPGRFAGMLETLLTRPTALRRLGWALVIARRTGLRLLFGGHGLLRLLLPGLARLERRAPLIDPPHPWRRTAARYLTPVKAGEPTPAATPGKTVALFSGCVMDAWFGRVHHATAKVLRANGYTVLLPERQGCCGALHLHGGDQETARAMARNNIHAWEALGPDVPVIVNSAGCGAALKDYHHLLAEDPNWRGHAHRFSHRVMDISEFLAGIELREPTRPLAPADTPLKVAYDDPCHLVHAQRIREEPRRVLARIPGVSLVPLADADWCCGGAGTYNITQPAMADRLLARKVAAIRASGASVVATGNPGCLMQIRQGLRQSRLPVRVAHPVELLAEAYDEPTGS